MNLKFEIKQWKLGVNNINPDNEHGTSTTSSPTFTAVCRVKATDLHAQSKNLSLFDNHCFVMGIIASQDYSQTSWWQELSGAASRFSLLTSCPHIHIYIAAFPKVRDGSPMATLHHY